MRWDGYIICDQPGHDIRQRTDCNGRRCYTCKAEYVREYKRRLQREVAEEYGRWNK